MNKLLVLFICLAVAAIDARARRTRRIARRYSYNKGPTKYLGSSGRPRTRRPTSRPTSQPTISPTACTNAPTTAPTAAPTAPTAAPTLFLSIQLKNAPAAIDAAHLSSLTQTLPHLIASVVPSKFQRSEFQQYVQQYVQYIQVISTQTTYDAASKIAIVNVYFPSVPVSAQGLETQVKTFLTTQISSPSLLAPLSAILPDYLNCVSCEFDSIKLASTACVLTGTYLAATVTFATTTVSACNELVVPLYTSASASSVIEYDKIGTRYGQGALDSNGGWASHSGENWHKNLEQWWQWDLGTQRMVTGVVTQGRADQDRWVNQYKVSHSSDNTTWFAVDSGNRFYGNYDRNTKVQKNFKTPVNTRYIRIEPTQWSGRISMRSGVVVTCQCNWDCYLARYEDLRTAFGQNLTAAADHYHHTGKGERRNCACECNWDCYLARYEDLRTAFGQDLVAAADHYNHTGKGEGRNCACATSHYPDDSPPAIPPTSAPPVAHIVGLKMLVVGADKAVDDALVTAFQAALPGNITEQIVNIAELPENTKNVLKDFVKKVDITLKRPHTEGLWVKKGLWVYASFPSIPAGYIDMYAPLFNKYVVQNEKVHDVLAESLPKTLNCTTCTLSQFELLNTKPTALPTLKPTVSPSASPTKSPTNDLKEISSVSTLTPAHAFLVVLVGAAALV